MKKQSSVMAWLLAACLSMGLLPDFILTICTLRTGEAPSGGLSFAVGFGTACISLFCFIGAVYTRFGREPADVDKKPDMISCVLGIFPCLLMYLLVGYTSHRILPVLAVVYGLGKGLFAGVMVMLAVGLALVLGLFFFCWLNSSRKLPLEHPVRRFFGRIYLGLPMAVLLWAAYLTLPFGLVLLRSIREEPGILGRHLTLMAGAFIMAGILLAAMGLAAKMLTEKAVPEKEAPPAKEAVQEKEALPAKEAVPEKEVPPAKEAVPEKKVSLEKKAASKIKMRSGRKRDLPLLIAMLLCFFLPLFQNLPQLTQNEAAMLEARLQDSLTEYGFYLAALDPGGAAGIAKEAAEQMDGALAAAEEAVEAAGLEESALRKAEKAQRAVEKVCERYMIFRTDGQALALLEQMKRNGGADKELVNEALEFSEEYPDNLWVQYTAAYIGSSLTYDDAGHYDRTAEAIWRCHELYRKETKPSADQQLSFGKDMAQMLLRIYREEEAARILEELAETDGFADTELYELLARCYNRSDRMQEAYELAAAYCEKQEDSPYLMYSAALAALKLEQREEALRYTSQLAAYTAGCQGEEQKDCDIWLFGMLEFLTLRDSASYTEFQYDVYQDLTEQENAIIDENPFFRNYLDAVYLAYRSEHKEEPEEAFQKVDAVLSERPELASAWYLRGIIASNSGKEEYIQEALDCYQRAGAYNDAIPAVWYAMAREYDRLGEYEKAIEACKRALALLPEQDHGNDWYGIQYHCSKLLRALQKEVQ